MSEHIKNLHGFQYYTGNHPAIRSHYRSGKKPKEFGNKVWATSLVLLDYLNNEPFELKNLKVLEIGCGWGLLGVYLAKQHSCDVTCTDYDEHVLAIAEMHGKLNDVPIRTQTASFLDHSVDFLKNFDLIIGAEVCYSSEVATEIIELIKRAYLAKVGQILIADPGRPDFDDCSEFCKSQFQTQILNLPGSVNGKTTQLLSARF